MSTPSLKTGVKIMKSKRATTSVVVINSLGLHSRPAALLVRTAQVFEAEIMLECRGARLNAKSIIGILTMGAERGTKLRVMAEGHDAEEAVCAIKALFACAFHEEQGDARLACFCSGRRNFPEPAEVQAKAVSEAAYLSAYGE
jgi:phosphocarrier protein HPr